MRTSRPWLAEPCRTGVTPRPPNSRFQPTYEGGTLKYKARRSSPPRQSSTLLWQRLRAVSNWRRPKTHLMGPSRPSATSNKPTETSSTNSSCNISIKLMLYSWPNSSTHSRPLACSTTLLITLTSLKLFRVPTPLPSKTVTDLRVIMSSLSASFRSTSLPLVRTVDPLDPKLM